MREREFSDDASLPVNPGGSHWVPAESGQQPEDGSVSTSLRDFIHDLDSRDVPARVLEQARLCLLDLVGVAAAGSTTRMSQIMRTYAATNHGGQSGRARLLFDGRRVHPAGAALANAATIDAMDGHDGHRLTRGHAGVAVLPAVLSVLDDAEASMSDLLTAMVVGYEVANRAGMALHATAGDYHSSGAWNALGAAAVAARILGLDDDVTGHALGIAEYHAPRAPMMRCIDHPTMVKDSSAWGAHAGVSAALLAAAGFTGAPAALSSDSSDSSDPSDEVGLWDDLGERWTLLEQYFKPYPVCRWAHPAVHATIGLVNDHDVAPEAIDHIEVTSFAAAARLAIRLPANTEQAQYSLCFPVAAAAVHRRLDPRAVADPTHVSEQVRRLSSTMRVRESPDMSAAFPRARTAEVSLVLTDSSRLSSGSTTAPGDPEERLSKATLVDKFLDAATDSVGRDRADRLLDLMVRADNPRVRDLLAEICPPSRPGGTA